MNYQNKTFSLITLGCPKNQVDSEVLAGELLSQGIRVIDDPDQADVLLINTCGFIEDAKQESIDTILEAVRYKTQGHSKEIYVWGCLAERYRNEIDQEIPEVDGYFGVEPFEQIGRFFIGSTFRFSDQVYARRVLTTPSHVAYLKIADGCDHQCSFCAIPLFKGSYRSRIPDSLMREAEALAQSGVKELILVAQDTSRYGQDLLSVSTLSSLIRSLAGIEGIQWIRIMYTHPNHVTDELIDTIASESKVCKYLDMPLQHVSESVLKAMGRGGNRAQFETLIRAIREKIPGLVLRTAFITGFPGEGMDEFQELLDFVETMRFERLGAFVYSPEDGTPAYALGNPIPRTQAEKRYNALMQCHQSISDEINAEKISQTLPVIADEYDETQNMTLARTQGDCFEIDHCVWIQGEVRAGDMVNVKIEDSSTYELYGYVLNQSPEV